MLVKIIILMLIRIHLVFTLLLCPKFVIKFKIQMHQHFPKYINTYSQDLEHN